MIRAAIGATVAILSGVSTSVGRPPNVPLPRYVMPPPRSPSYGFIDRAGKVVVPPACDFASLPDAGPWVSIERDGKQGFLNLRTRAGTGLIFDSVPGALFSDAPLFDHGPEPVRRGKAFGYVDSTGKAILPFHFDHAERFSSDRLAIAGENGKVGYIDERGRFVIPPSFSQAVAFDAFGLARVKVSNQWGVIDRKGRFVTAAQYTWIDAFTRARLAVVTRGNLSGAIDTRGRLVTPIKFPQLRDFAANGLAAANTQPRDELTDSDKPNWGFVDRSGRFVVPARYESVSDFDPATWQVRRAPPGLAEVTSADSAGVETGQYVDGHGHIVLSLPEGLSGGLYSEGLFDVFRSRPIGGWALFDPRKQVQNLIWFDSLGSFNQGLAPASIGWRWGYVDRLSQVVIAPRFERAEEFSPDGLAIVQLADTHAAAFIDRTGRLVLKTHFADATAFSGSGFSRIGRWRLEGTPIGLPADACSAVK